MWQTRLDVNVRTGTSDTVPIQRGCFKRSSALSLSFLAPFVHLTCFLLPFLNISKIAKTYTVLSFFIIDVGLWQNDGMAYDGYRTHIIASPGVTIRFFSLYSPSGYTVNMSSQTALETKSFARERNKTRLANNYRNESHRAHSRAKRSFCSSPFLGPHCVFKAQQNSSLYIASIRMIVGLRWLPRI